MQNIIRQMFSLLTPTERKQAYGCFVAMLMMAFVEVIGVASIMPFIAVLADPDAISHHAKLAWLYHYFQFSNQHHFLIFLGSLVLGILIVGNAVSMFTTWSIFKFTYAREYSLSTRIFNHYIREPYLFFLNRNTSELSKNVLSEVTTIINRAFIPAMQLVAKSIIASLILLLLVVVDPILALVLGGLLGGAYISIYVAVRRRLATISKHCMDDNQNKYKIVTESFYGIKDIKLLAREPFFLKQFAKYAKRHADESAVSHIIAHVPRYALETIAFGGVMAIIMYLLLMQKNINDALPLLALYAFASLRLMPALQQIFTSVAFLKVSRDALNKLTTDLQHETKYQAIKTTTLKPLPFQEAIKLKEISFQYPLTDKLILQQINLTIPVNTTIGIVGMTGAGKTTIVDIILGLLKPTNGEVLIDDFALNNANMRAWQQNIGYVPQSIFLADDTIKKNIAFGLSDSEINDEAIIQAAKLANIHDFIMQELQHGYNTVVGDRGIRLSGGQRQRIGIARALYHNPSVLVMDEATNALDNKTELTIMEAMAAFQKQKTLIIVAHRLSTLKDCDQIYVFHKGLLHASGTYQTLIATDANFRTLAGLEQQGKPHESIRHYTSAS